GMAIVTGRRRDLALGALEYFGMRRTRPAEPAQHSLRVSFDEAKASAQPAKTAIGRKSKWLKAQGEARLDLQPVERIVAHHRRADFQRGDFSVAQIAAHLAIQRQEKPACLPCNLSSEIHPYVGAGKQDDKPLWTDRQLELGGELQ